MREPIVAGGFRGDKPVVSIVFDDNTEVELSARSAVGLSRALHLVVESVLLGAFVRTYLLKIGMPDNLIEEAILELRKSMAEAITNAPHG